MKKSLVIGGVLGLALVVAVVTALVTRGTSDGARGTTPESGSIVSGRSAASATGAASPDRLIEEFRATERTCIQRFNTALREQRENAMDELELSNTIERDVLEPWRALRTKVTAASVPPGREDMYATLRRYMEARQISWEAYETALRASSDAESRPHYEMHRTKNAEAQAEAKHLGELFRALSTN